MPAHVDVLENLASDLRDSVRLTDSCTKIWVYRAKTIVLDFSINGLKFALDLSSGRGVLTATVLGRNDAGRRVLRNAYVGRYEMLLSGGERHMVGVLKDAEEFPEAAAEQCHQWIREARRLVSAQIPSDQRDILDGSFVNLFWWDNKPNFGDAVGPWLSSKITGKNPLNARGSDVAVPPIMSVGSILNLIEQDGTKVWGTGLMGPLSRDDASRLRKFSNVSVHAVRGKLTRDEVKRKLGWDVPEIYGDPALLLPMFLPVSKASNDTELISIVPHYLHFDYCKELRSDRVDVLDVRDGMERVIRRIASSRVCISTSLHGLIIAQAYGIPWVWVRLNDRQLGGDTFKFHDFFSTLDASAVSSVDISAVDMRDVDVEALAGTAMLPQLQISLDDLLQSFPHANVDAAFDDERVGDMGSGSPSREETATSEDVANPIEVLLRKMDAIAGELEEQRRLLEKLSSVR